MTIYAGAQFTTPSGRVVRIRSAVPDDAGKVLEYLRRVGSETDFLSFGAEGIDLDERAERAVIEAAALADNALFVIATVEDAIVAVLSFNGGTRARARHAGEFGISIVSAYWGEGIGKRLMEVLLEWARETGVVRKINLHVREDNLRAISLYERMGFVVEGRVTRGTWCGGRFFDTVLMGVRVG